MSPRLFSTEASSDLLLNFSLPSKTIYSSHPVSSVIVPGAAGEYGVTEGHTPIVSELKSGLVTINHKDGTSEKYFVPGGFSLTHSNNTTDLTTPVAVKLDDIDGDAVGKNFAEAKKGWEAAEEGSQEKAARWTEMETFKSIATAVGVNVA